MKADGKRRIKRFILASAIVAVVGLRVWNDRAVRYPDDIGSKLSLQLHVDKESYVQAEPVRLTALIVNITDKPIRVSFPMKRRPFSISFYMSRESDSWEKNSESAIPRAMIASDTWMIFNRLVLPERRALVIEPNRPSAVQEWVMDHYSTDLGHGPVEFKARLALKSLFSSNAHVFESNKLKIECTQPVGMDKEAYDLITSRKSIRTGSGSFGPGFLYRGLIGDGSCEPVFQYFLKDHGATSYAPYIQYSLAISHRHHRCREYGESLLSVLESAPSDFPLLAELHIELLDYYWANNDLEKMAELAQSEALKQLNVLNPERRRRLDYLLEEIAWWPPDTPEEKYKAERAFRTREAVRTATSHWLTETLLKEYGEHYRNELQFGNRQPEQTGLYFYDKEARECIHVTYHFDKESVLTHTEVYGPLASASVGRLRGLSSRLQADFKLDEEDISSAKIIAVLRGGTLEGKLVKGKKSDDIVIPHFVFHIEDMRLGGD